MNFGIIAAGEGSRLAGEGVERSKPLVEICGMPMIGRLLRILDRVGAERVAVIVNGRMPEVARYLEEVAPRFGGRLSVKVKSTPSSMHSFHEICGSLRDCGKYVVTTVDTIFREEDFRRYIEAWENAADDVDGMMAVTTFVDDEKPLWVETGDGMDIVAFRDTPWSEARYVSGGIYGLRPEAAVVLDDCVEQGVERMRNYQRALVAAGQRLQAFDMGRVMDIDHAPDIKKAELWLESR